MPPPCSLAFIVPTDERGTTWSTFEYARHSAAALNLKPLILFAHTKQPGVLARWIENFDTVASYDLSRTRFSITNASGGSRLVGCGPQTTPGQSETTGCWVRRAGRRSA